MSWLALISFLVGAKQSGPFLEVVNPRAGQLATLALSNAQPFMPARFGWSIAGPGPTVFSSVFGPVEMAFGSPYTLTPPLMTDVQGKASFTRPLPPNSVGITIWAQGVVYDAHGFEKTNPVIEIVI